MNKLIFLGLGLIPILMLTVSNVYASGPRYDSPENSTAFGGACWEDGYDAGFAGKYDEDRADECIEKANDEYNGSWKWACKDAGYMPDECQDFKNNPTNDINHAALEEQNRRDCYNDGYEDGQNNPFDHDRDNGCFDYSNSYYNGFIAGCESVDNTKETCESFTDA